MIDTDKYEGHTEGPWEIIEREVPDPQWDVMLSCPEVGKFASIQGSNGWRPTEVELELIADAPLLLAEVKRWHKVRDYILEKASYPTVKKLHLKDLLNFMEEVIE